MKPRILLAYYSMTGHTRTLALELCSALQCDLEEIREPRLRKGFSGMLRALYDALSRREPPIETAHHDPAVYDMLVLGGPVWAARMASPMRTYAHRYAGHAPKLAFFCTEGGRGAGQAFDELVAVCGKKPEATLAVDARHLPPGMHRDAARHFIARLHAAAPTQDL